MYQIQLGSQHKMYGKKHHMTTIQSNKYSIPDDNFNQYQCSALWIDILSQFWCISFLTPPHKGKVSALQLDSITNKVTLQRRKNTLCNGIQYNHLISKQPQKYTVWFPKYSKLSVVTLYNIVHTIRTRPPSLGIVFRFQLSHTWDQSLINTPC